MPWFRVEENFHSHPKVRRAGNAATGLWVRCGTWSSNYLTDGFIPEETVREFGNRRELDALLATRLWVSVESGVLMPDYLEYNPSAEQVRQQRKRDAERKRSARANGAQAVDHDSTTGQFRPRRQP